MMWMETVTMPVSPSHSASGSTSAFGKETHRSEKRRHFVQLLTSLR